MTANATIYAPTDQLIPLSRLREIAGHDKITAIRSPSAAISQLRVAWDDCEMTINVMESEKIPSHLQGLRGYVIRLLGGEVDEGAEAFLERVSEIKQVLGMVIEPGSDAHGKCKRLILAITDYYDGFFFMNDSLHDSQGSVILGPQGGLIREMRKDKTSGTDEAKVSSSAMARKERSEAILEQEGVPHNVHLPVIEDESSAKRRSRGEIAKRALALGLVAVKGEGLEQERVLRVLHKYKLESSLTPKERAFVFDDNPSQQDRTNFTWRYEGYWVLLWALGYIDQLGRPDHICDVPTAVRVMTDRTAEEFVEDARLRPLAEILDQADLIYRYHWAVVDARIKGTEPPANLDAGVVYERHYALNWLIGYMDQEWDDVTTDT